MASQLYIETTIPSAHATNRTDPGSAYRRENTREWWLEQLSLYEAWISDAVVLELEKGGWPGREAALSLVEPLRRLAIDEEISAVARRCVAELLVPAELGGDALHLAVACVHEVEFLLTWNIRHLANPNKLGHLTVINRRLGLLTPQIVTP